MQKSQSRLQQLGIRPGLTAVIGSGGKTTLIKELAEELRAQDPRPKIVLTTTTHIYPFKGMPLITDDEESLEEALSIQGIACVGSWTQEGKLKASGISFSAMKALADYVLVEADGSKHKPIKAHADYDPVVPAGTDRTILVVGSQGLGKTVQGAVHRPELFCQRTGASMEDVLTRSLVEKYINQEIEEGLIKPNVIYWTK